MVQVLSPKTEIHRKKTESFDLQETEWTMTLSWNTVMTTIRFTQEYHQMTRMVNQMKSNQTKNSQVEWIQRILSSYIKLKSYVSHATNQSAQYFVPAYVEDHIIENVMTRYLTIKINLSKTTNLMKSLTVLRNGKKKSKHNKNALPAYLKVMYSS